MTTTETDKKMRIYDAAEELFLATGVDGVSLAQIAKAAGVPASLICHHYGTKETLWHEVVRRNFSRLAKVRERLHGSEGTPINRLRSLLQSYHLELAKDAKLRRLLLLLDLKSCTSPETSLIEDLQAGCRLVAECQAQGFLPSVHNPRQLFVMLIGVAEYPMFWREDYLGFVDGPSESATDVAYLAIIDAMLNGLQELARQEMKR